MKVYVIAYLRLAFGGGFGVVVFVWGELQFTAFHLHVTTLYTILHLTLFDTAKQICLLDQVIEQTLPLHKFGGAIELGHCAPVQHDNSIAVEDGVDAVRNCDDGLVLEHARP